MTQGEKKCQVQLTLYAKLQERNICYYKGTVWYNPELSPLGEKKDIFFHIFALKYAYTLRIQMNKHICAQFWVKYDL